MRTRISARQIYPLCLIVWVILDSAFVRTESSLRPVRLDDRFAMEVVGGAAFAPDGHAVAITRQRSVNSVPPALFVPTLVRSDVWLQEAAGQPLQNLTNGSTDGSGAWGPTWAPDGARLAYLSNRGGSVRLWVWERGTRRTRQVSAHEISYEVVRLDDTCRWVDVHRLVCVVEPGGSRSYFENALGESSRLPSEAWARAARGEVTASALSSLEFRHDPRRLWLVDVRTGKGTVVGETAEMSGVAGARSMWWVAPDSRTVAFARREPSTYNLVSLIKMGMPRSLELRALDGRHLPFDRALPENIHTLTLRWSPDGRELAFFANGSAPINPLLLFGAAAASVMPERIESRENPARLYRVTVAEGKVEEVGTGEIDLGELGSPEFYWTAQGELVFHAPRKRFGMTNGPPASRGAPFGGGGGANAVTLGTAAPREWWLLGRNGQTRPLVPTGSRLPETLRPVNGGAAFVGLRDGDVWLVEPGGTVTNLTATFTPRVTDIVSMVEAQFQAVQLVVQVQPSGSVDTPTPSGPTPPETAAARYHRIDLASRVLTPVPAPRPTATLSAVAPATRSAIFTVDDRTGTFLWRTKEAEGAPELLVETNTFVRELARPQCRMISYIGLNGDPLKAELCLPLGYVSGRRYPMVAAVRHATIQSEERSARSAAAAGVNDRDVYSAAGYAYLSPSIPQNLQGLDREEGDSLLMTINGVLPAVERAISDGFADPDRLFVTGSSRGGWTTLGLVGLTTRFKAAISVSLGIGGRQGSLDHNASRRYTDNPMGAITPNGSSNKSYRPSDLPWWRDGDLYRRNDPLNYVDRVKTPVMIIHGDLDPVPFDESEKYFYALVSMRKPAEFIRYWGEGHGNRIPANVRDEYQRTFAWFDRWGDIARDSQGSMIFEGSRVKSRNGAPVLTPQDFARFGPAAPAPANGTSSERSSKPAGSQSPVVSRRAGQ